MANNVVLMSADLTSTWIRMVEEPLVANYTLTAMATGGMVYQGASIEIRQGAATTHWPLNSPIRLWGVDLSTLEFRSTDQDVRLCVIGNTR